MTPESVEEVEEESQTIDAIARDCLLDAGGDWQEAAKSMEKTINTDAELKAALLEPMLAKVIWAAIRQAARETRATFWVHGSGTDNVTGITEMANRTLLDFPLPGGKRLGDATAEDVEKARGFYHAQAAGNARAARFLAAVKVAMGDSEKVSDALTHDRLETLQKDTENE